MKNITKLLLVTGAAVALTSAVRADEPFLSPRAKANQSVRLAGSGNDADLARGQNTLGDAARSKTAGLPIVVGSSKNDPDLVRGQWDATGSPKGLQQLRDSGRTFQVAPLK